MDDTTLNRKEIKSRYRLHFVSSNLVQTLANGGNITVLAVIPGTHNGRGILPWANMAYLAGVITFDYKGF